MDNIPWKGYRTFSFNIVVAIVWLLLMVFGVNATAEGEQLKTVISQLFELLEVGLPAIILFGNIILRAITSTPIFNRE